MIQPQTQIAQYWGPDFALDDSDIERINNHLLEIERPQTVAQIAQIIIQHRVNLETQKIERLLSGRMVYQPRNSYAVGDKLVFPILEFAQGEVTVTREGYNPQHAPFNVIQVDVDGTLREFAADFQEDHLLSADNAEPSMDVAEVDVDALYELYGRSVEDHISALLTELDEFVCLGQAWFIEALMAEVNVGHYHLTEAILEMHEGGPLSTDEILPHLDMDPSLDESVLRFSLNYGLLQDERFDEVAPGDQILWFLRRLEPNAVKEIPGRIQYSSIPYDRALLSPQLLMLERELDDEWSNLDAVEVAEAVNFTLLFPHRWAGVIPISSRIRPLISEGNSPRQRIVFVDEFTKGEIVGWVVQNERYIVGLSDWYEKNGIPIGGYVELKPDPDSDKIILSFGRRRAHREWVRLATAVDNQIHFKLEKRSVACGYDDLLIVGTDVTAAIDALWRRADSHQRNIASLLAEIFVSLADLTPQQTVHAKTLYSAINMLRRIPPGPLFAELVRHPAFVPVGDHYWQFDNVRWQESN